MDFQEVWPYHKSCCWSFQREDTLLVALLGLGLCGSRAWAALALAKTTITKDLNCGVAHCACTRQRPLMDFALYWREHKNQMTPLNADRCGALNQAESPEAEPLPPLHK